MVRFRSQIMPFSTVMAAWCIAALAGCSQPANARRSSPQDDPYSEAISELEDKRQRPFIEAAKPILEAIARRDYDALYDLMSPHALKKVDTDQFGPDLDPRGEPKKSKIITEMTKEQFLEMMGEMENRLQAPRKVTYLYVQTSDPDELAGNADTVDNMFNLGGMPKEIPFDIRRASIRAQIQCHLSDDAAKQIAKDLKISEERARAGDLPENDQYGDEILPYLNLKFVLVEEEDNLKVGYFEFMPPSILD
jgi:hypothetical protein